jgi:hypothetical protein
MADYRRQALEQRRARLLEDYQAVNDQLSRALSAVEENRLKRQIEALDADLQDVDRQLEGLAAGAGPALAAPPVPEEPREPNLAAVRELLVRGFTAADFRRLFVYTSQPDLKLIVHELSPGDGLATMVDKAMERCLAQDLLPDLLGEVKRANPRMYAKYESQLYA